MKSFKSLTMIAGLVVVLALSGCAKPPQDKIDAAKAALDDARNAQADKYVPQAWAQAEEALSSAMAEVQAQESKFALFRSFDEAQTLLQKRPRREYPLGLLRAQGPAVSRSVANRVELTQLAIHV